MNIITISDVFWFKRVIKLHMNLFYFVLFIETLEWHKLPIKLKTK